MSIFLKKYEALLHPLIIMRLFAVFAIFTVSIFNLLPPGALSLNTISGLLIILVSFILIYLKPEYFIYASLLFWTLRGIINPDDILAINSLISFNLSGFINILLIFLGILYFLINYKNPFRNDLIIIFAVLIVFCSISLIYSEYLYGGIRFLARIMIPFVFYLLVINEIKEEEDVINLIKCIMVSAIFPFLIGIYQLIIGQGNTVTKGFIRIYSTFEHPNAYSFFLVLLFCILYTILLSDNSKWRIVLFFLLNVILTLLIIRTYCRISWIAFIIVFSILSFRYRKRRLIIKLVIICFILAIILFIFLSSSVFERFSSVPDIFNSENTALQTERGPSGVAEKTISEENTINTGNSMGWRLNAWIYLLKDMNTPRTFIFGHGLGSVYLKMQELYGDIIHPHNAFIGVFYDTGIIGLILFILTIGILLWKAILLATNVRREGNLFNFTSIYLVSLIAFLIIALSDNIFESPDVSIYFWVFFAIGSNIYNIYRTKKINKKEI